MFTKLRWFDEIFFVRLNFSFYHTVLWTGNLNYSLSHFFGKNFVKATFSLKKSWFDELFFILPHCNAMKIVAVKFRDFYCVLCATLFNILSCKFCWATPENIGSAWLNVKHCTWKLRKYTLTSFLGKMLWKQRF